MPVFSAGFAYTNQEDSSEKLLYKYKTLAADVLGCKKYLPKSNSLFMLKLLKHYKWPSTEMDTTSVDEFTLC